MYVKKGSGFVKINNVITPFHEDQIVFIDCYKPHAYASNDELEIYWLHFDGNASREYYEYITYKSGNVIQLKETFSFEKNTMKVFNMFHMNNKINEALISKYITNLLTDLIVFINDDTPNNPNSDLIEDTISYICNNLTNSLSLDELSSRVSLSPYYFTRFFKKETGYTPHEFVINTRLNAAKFYLKSTQLPIKEICYNCGFTSESSFCATFKKNLGMTPSEYRAFK